MLFYGLLTTVLMRNILVTGGAGFIGSHLVARLLAEGQWRVTVVDDFNDFYDPALKRRNVEPHLGREELALGEVFKEAEFDCVVHLAARAGVRPSLLEPVLYTETNVDGTVNLLELARA